MERQDISHSKISENDLPILEATPKEELHIKQLQALYPTLDYLMCLTLIKSTNEQLNEVIKSLPTKMKFQPDTSTVIKDMVIS